MILNLIQRIFSSDVRRENVEERQMRELREYEASHAAIVEKENAVITEPTRKDATTSSPYASDIAALEECFGCLYDGMEITLTLRKALEIMPRPRKKADAYKGVKSELKRLYGVTLSIGNNNNATNNNGKI